MTRRPLIAFMLILAFLTAVALAADEDPRVGKEFKAHPDTLVFESFQNASLYWGSTSTAENEYLIEFKLEKNVRFKVVESRRNPYERDGYLYMIEISSGKHQDQSGWIGDWDLTRGR